MTVVCHRVEQLGLNVALQLLVGVPLEMVHGATRIGLVYVAGVVAGRQGPLWRSSPGKVRGDPRGDTSPGFPRTHRSSSDSELSGSIFPTAPQTGRNVLERGQSV